MGSPESPELSRHLDDELPRAQLPENLRQEAEGFDRVIAAIGRGPDRLPRSVREQVMQQVRAIHAPWWARAWRWFATPRPMRLSPLHGALALAALVAVILLAVPKYTPMPRQASADQRVATRFVYLAPNASRVSVTGEFAGWDPNGIPMRRDADGNWVAEIDLPPGLHHYVFVVDGTRWAPDPNAASQVDDGYGLQNSVLLVICSNQGPGRLEARLDPQTIAGLQPVLAEALIDSLPARPLEDKALEGAAKRVPSARIVDAVRQLATSMHEGRMLLRSGAPTVTPSEAEIVAAADARRRGVPPGEISALRRDAPGSALVVPLTVLSDLVQRGVPADQARSVIADLVRHGTSLEQIAQLPGRVDVAIRVGATPAAALRGAIPAAATKGPPPGLTTGSGKSSNRGKGKGQ